MSKQMGLTPSLLAIELLFKKTWRVKCLLTRKEDGTGKAVILWVHPWTKDYRDVSSGDRLSPREYVFSSQRGSPDRNHAVEQRFVSWGSFPQRKGFFLMGKRPRRLLLWVRANSMTIQSCTTYIMLTTQEFNLASTYCAPAIQTGREQQHFRVTSMWSQINPYQLCNPGWVTVTGKWIRICPSMSQSYCEN